MNRVAVRWAYALARKMARRAQVRAYTSGSHPLASRVCHLSVYSDRHELLGNFFRDGLELPVVVPATAYAYADEHEGAPSQDGRTKDGLSFSLEMFLLGSGVGIETYCDPGLHAARIDAGQPPGCIASVALEPPTDSTDTAHALLDRHLMEMQPKPVVYHIPDDEIAGWAARQHKHWHAADATASESAADATF